ncbi:hypothetical protein TTHERM_00455230 (macronuclear) [Tetrahymena thermophila SB210]|uniref:Uncharacterized protein n=1 Tax=Tetrahymena thermophila (strain SB210) TaxID=312017 RepID=I7MA81_TETTS|nr:hypothetical protein TTHERM_00455230 [Tetrahymena thermophila SB210]EAS03884.2 hypothetical protein TTHERM_00455230 [Tetrahymena thermophila SB210]|eukprot:XP_001024129.2 hypothetical protein TTHERM_00455230 [Tetrahymena thermophila SB210]
MSQSQQQVQGKEKDRAAQALPILNNQLDIIVYHGELGYLYSYSNVSADKKISFIQENILKDIKIEIPNQFLTTKTGYLIQPDDVLAEIERDNALAQTQRLIDSTKYKMFHNIFVFNVKLLMDNTEAAVNFFQQEQENQLKQFNKISLDAKKPQIKLDSKYADTDYQYPVELNDGQKQLVQLKNQNILELEQKFYKFYSSIKRKAYEFIQKWQKVERASKEYEIQYKSIECLLMRVINEYQVSKNLSTEMHQKIKNLNEVVSKSVQKYEESLKIGKNVELPDVLKKDNKKYLYDIYYDVSKMDQWKSHCINHYEKIKKTHSKEQEEISSLKRQIKDQQATIQQLSNENIETIKKFDDQCLEGKNYTLTSFNGVYEEYKNLRKCIQYIIDNQQDEYTLKTSLDNCMLQCQDKLKDQEKIEKQITQYIDALGNYITSIWESKFKQFQRMQQYQQKFTQILNGLNTITYDKLKSLEPDISRLEKDISDLTKPYTFFTNFKVILKEVSRRNEFNSLLDNQIKIINSIIKIEQQKRVSFIANYGKCMPKDFIPELNMNVKPYPQNYEKLPKIENEHDEKDKYFDLFKQLELPEYGLKQEEMIADLKKELQMNLLNNKHKKDPHQIELEYQNSELRNQIMKLKNEIEMLNLKRKDDNSNIQIDLLTKKNTLLQDQINKLEQQLNQVNNSNEYVKAISSLQKQLDERDKAYQNLHLYYQKDNKENYISAANQNDANNAVNKTEEAKIIEKLNTRVANLTVLLQQSAKISFNQILRKQNDKQQKLQDKIFQQEQKLIASQEESQKEKNKYISFHEEKIKQIEQRYYSENKKVLSLLDQTKEQHKDEINLLNQKIKSQECDMIEKTKQLKNAQEQIARLNSQISQKQKEYEELNKKSQQVENRLKTDNAKQVTELQSQLQKDSEKYKKRLAQLETDLANKQSVLQNQTKDFNNVKRDLDLKHEEYEKVQYELQQVQNERDRLKKDVMNLKNRIENLDQTVEKNRLEIQQLNKQNQALNNEKQSISEDIQKDKQQVQDLQKRLTQILDSVKSLESERSRLLSQIESQKLDLDKKKIEIDNLNKQVYEQSNERAQQLEKLMESQMNEKLKISALNEQVQIYKIEIDQFKTKMQILEADIQARDEKIKILNKNIETQKITIDENDKKIESLVSEQSKVIAENEQKNQLITNLNAAIEQALIECEIQQKNANSKKVELEEKQEEYKHELERLQNEINELGRNLATCKERERETNNKNVELIQQIEEANHNLNQKEQELNQIVEEMNLNKNHINSNEMSLKQLNLDLKERDDYVSNLQDEVKNLTQQLEDLQRQDLQNQQEIENLNSQINKLKNNLNSMEDKNQELQSKTNNLLQNVIDLQSSLQQLRVEKELIEQNNQLLQESLQKEKEEKEIAIRCQDEQEKEYEKLKNSTICIDAHTQALDKLEIKNDQQKLEIEKQQEQLEQFAQQLITAETTIQSQKKQLDGHKIIQENYLKTISELSSKLNVEKKDSECQWEEEQDEKMISLSTYEAQKFRKLLKSIDHNKKIPIMSQKNIEHIDITQALKKTSIIQESINFTKLEEGTKMLFIPSSNDIYVPLILKQLNDGAIFNDQNTSASSASLSISTYKNNYFLDFDTLDKKVKELLTECSLIMIANIKNIIPKQVNIDNNPFGLKENESYFLLQVEQPEYIVGLEDEDHTIKNYA